jgi:hypothetical protein
LKKNNYLIISLSWCQDLRLFEGGKNDPMTAYRPYSLHLAVLLERTLTPV